MAGLAITGSIRGSSRENIYKELGVETLKSRRWLRRLYCFYKIKNHGIPSYLANTFRIPFNNTRNIKNVTTYFGRPDAFSYSFFHGQSMNGINLVLTLEHPVLVSSEPI